MIQENKTAGIILAAGASTRFGQPKQLLRLSSKYLVEWVLEAAINTRLKRIILVLGYAHQKIQQALGKKRNHPKLQIEINPHYEDGQSGSLQIGLSCVRDTYPAVMFLLADQPLVDAVTLNFLLEQFWSSHKNICVPSFAGKIGNPCIFSSHFYPQIMQISGDIGARRIIQANPKQVHEVPIQNPHFFLDIDTPADLEKIKALV
ncbi:MAG: nucleotidyltransferase family protein [Deltaproteobacteria bacterium]|jgi:molybdenum cofactor cytidylyltransferase|nr:nucleotidyltransferase family protein [Deltaproteobacteria bacterium]MBW2516631.1 nucleotidyltransferase family protein [Deltaproteobacteria bacterium]